MNKAKVPNLIQMYMHCAKCVEEASKVRSSPKDYANLSVGLTEEGEVQVWCERHDESVAIFEVK